MAEVEEQAIYDHLRVQTQHKLDLTQESCAPDQHPVTGKPLFSYEDEPHKLAQSCPGNSATASAQSEGAGQASHSHYRSQIKAQSSFVGAQTVALVSKLVQRFC